MWKRNQICVELKGTGTYAKKPEFTPKKEAKTYAADKKDFWPIETATKVEKETGIYVIKDLEFLDVKKPEFML